MPPTKTKPTRAVITVVGSFAVGMTIRAPKFPVAGETLRGSDFDMGPGGKGSNQAVAAARLGAESHLVAKLGQDRFADMALELYAAEGVGTRYLSQTSERPTGVGFITLNAAGENHIVLDMGANELLLPADVLAAEPQIARSHVVMSVLEIRPETAACALELGYRHGALTILNPAPAAQLDPSLFRFVDVLTPNESELRILLGRRPDDPTESVELARELLALGMKQIVITQGSRGALLVDGAGKTTQFAAIPVQTVDTTGAGDAFTASLAVALGEGKGLTEAVYFALRGGALTCTRLGVVPALPYRKDMFD
jgi:ribokinase